MTDPNQIEQTLRNNPALTDALRADIFDLHTGNSDAIQHPVLKALAFMRAMTPEQLQMAESHPHIFKAFVEQRRGGGK